MTGGQASGVTVNANPPDQGAPLWEQLLVGLAAMQVSQLASLLALAASCWQVRATAGVGTARRRSRRPTPNQRPSPPRTLHRQIRALTSCPGYHRVAVPPPSQRLLEVADRHHAGHTAVGEDGGYPPASGVGISHQPGPARAPPGREPGAELITESHVKPGRKSRIQKGFRALIATTVALNFCRGPSALLRCF